MSQLFIFFLFLLPASLFLFYMEIFRKPEKPRGPEGGHFTRFSPGVCVRLWEAPHRPPVTPGDVIRLEVGPHPHRPDDRAAAMQHERQEGYARLVPNLWECKVRVFANS